jgi:hypothetical protein
MLAAKRLYALALAVAASLSLLAAPASSRTRIEVSTTAFRVVMSNITYSAGAVEVICDLTLHSTLRRLFNKVRGELIGSVTSISAGNVRVNRGTNPTCALLPPLSIRYESIRGSLPIITGLLAGLEWRWLYGADETFWRVGCLYEGVMGFGSAENPIRSWALLRPNTLGLVRDLTGFGCEPTTDQGVTNPRLSPEVSVRLLER